MEFVCNFHNSELWKLQTNSISDNNIAGFFIFFIENLACDTRFKTDNGEEAGARAKVLNKKYKKTSNIVITDGICL